MVEYSVPLEQKLPATAHPNIKELKMKLLSIALLFIGLCHAAPKLEMNDNVKKFMSPHESSYMRTGHIRENKKMDSTQYKWPPSDIFYRSVLVSENTSKIYNLVFSFCPEGKFEYQEFPESATIIAIAHKTREQLINAADSTKLINAIKAKLLPRLLKVKDLELHDIALLYTDKYISGASIRLRRIFNNGIMVDNSSYIEMSINSQLDVEQVEMVWPDFFKDPSPHLMLSKDSALAVLSSVLNDKFSSVIADGVPTYVESFTITSATNAWMLIYLKEKEVLSPAYSFILSAKLNTGVTTPITLSIPLIKESYEKP